MSNKREKRILKEFKELQESREILEQSGIYFHINDDDISKLYVFLVGQVGTPYHNGFYFFEFTYPNDYPMVPPSAIYHTQGNLRAYSNSINFKIRFNPNLYSCGKVCLSMLNTWSGPGWVPTNTMSNVLIALQAIVLNEEPLRNEPGFETSPKDVIDKYSKLIEYANLKIAIIQMAHKPPFPFFKDKVIELFNKNKDFYRDTIIKKHISNGSKPILLESPAYSMKCYADYSELLEELDLFDDIEEISGINSIKDLKIK